MSVPAGKRKQSKFEAWHHFYKLRKEVTELLLLDFGFSYEKYERKIEKFRNDHRTAQNVDEVTARWKAKADGFIKWYIDEECTAIMALIREIQKEFTIANSIFPSDTDARIVECCERRKHLNNAIGLCFALKQEIQAVIDALPVDINKYKRFSDLADEQIALFKGIRKADNRFFKPDHGKKKKKESEEKASEEKPS